MILLETERLVLRNLRAEDAEEMFDYRNHPLCARYQREQTKDRAGLEALIQAHRQDELSASKPCLLAVARKDTDRLVGEIVVMPGEATFSLGYTFSYRHHRQGYAFESLSALIGLLHRRFPDWEFICFTDPANLPSRALLQKLGFRDLGLLAAKESEVFGKWLRAETEAEIAAAVGRR